MSLTVLQQPTSDPSSCTNTGSRVGKATTSAGGRQASARQAGCKTPALLTTHHADDLDADLLTSDLASVDINANAGLT